MNLIHGFYSNNSLINPDMRLMQRGTLAHQLQSLITDRKMRVGHLYQMKNLASSSVKNWESLIAYFDELAVEAKKPYREQDAQYLFVTYLVDAIYLIEKHGIDWGVPIQSLILDECQIQETHDHALRSIHNFLNVARQYAEQF